MAKITTKLDAQDRVILFCAATGISHHYARDAVHGRPGIHAHNRETGVYALTDSGRAALMAILEDAGLK
jgi:hypothetical protein